MAVQTKRPAIPTIPTEFPTVTPAASPVATATLTPEPESTPGEQPQIALPERRIIKSAATTPSPTVTPTPEATKTPDSEPGIAGGDEKQSPPTVSPIAPDNSPVNPEASPQSAPELYWGIPQLHWGLIAGLCVSWLIIGYLLITKARLKKKLDEHEDAAIEAIAAPEYQQLGDLATEHEHLRLARKCYRKSAQIESTAENPYKIGLAHFQSEEYEEAIIELRKCLQDNALKPRAYFYLAYAHLNLGSMEKAEDFFKEALKFKRDDPYIYVGMGVIAQSRQQYEQAKQHYRKALELDQSCQEAKENLKQLEGY